MIYQKLSNIFWKDVITASSYRLGFILQFVGPFFMVLSFYFLSQLFADNPVEGLQAYGGDYFSFVLVGMIFVTYAGISLGSAVGTIRAGQSMGTLELIMTTRTSLATYLLGSSLYSLLRSTLIVIIFLSVGVVAFGVDFHESNLGVAVVILLLSNAIMVGLGTLSGCFTLVFKQGDPFTLAINSGAFLLSGVAYPISVLPGWLEAGSAVLPHTYALEVLRLSLLQGASFAEVALQIGALCLFTAAIIPVTIFFFQYAMRRSKVEGSFSHY